MAPRHGRPRAARPSPHVRARRALRHQPLVPSARKQLGRTARRRGVASRKRRNGAGAARPQACLGRGECGRRTHLDPNLHGAGEAGCAQVLGWGSVGVSRTEKSGGVSECEPITSRAGPRRCLARPGHKPPHRSDERRRAGPQGPGRPAADTNSSAAPRCIAVCASTLCWWSRSPRRMIVGPVLGAGGLPGAGTESRGCRAQQIAQQQRSGSRQYCILLQFLVWDRPGTVPVFRALRAPIEQPPTREATSSRRSEPLQPCRNHSHDAGSVRTSSSFRERRRQWAPGPLNDATRARRQAVVRREKALALRDHHLNPHSLQRHCSLP